MFENEVCRGHALRIAVGITALVLLMAGGASAAIVTVSDRQILVDGIPFTIKGIGYAPTPIGIDPETTSPYGDYFTFNYASIYNRDLPLLRQMGANTIRLWGWNNTANHADFLNKSYNNGTNPVYVIVSFWMGPSVYSNISSPDVRAQVKANFRNMVATHKNNPAVLMWGIGNELNAPWMYGNNLSDLFSLINEMAHEAHLEEGVNYHPVTTPLADINLINTIATYNSNMTYLDIWSVNLYRGSSFGSFFSDYKNVSVKPLVILEYGIDSYNNTGGDEYEKTGTSYQATYAASLWKEIKANSNVSSGGSIMAYSDEWWKGKYGQTMPGCPDYNASFHSNCGYSTVSHPDGYSNEEWWGVMRTIDNGSNPDIMQPRAAYYTLQSLWTASTPISSCTNITSPGTYVLNQSIINSSASTCINITSSDVIFDGAGYMIDGIDDLWNNYYGVYVHNSTATLTNVTVKNVIVTDWLTGIYYISTINGSITNNTVNSNILEGFRLWNSTNNVLTNNTANLNCIGIRLLTSSNNNLITNNTANSNTYYCAFVFDPPFGYFSYIGYGIYLDSSDNNTIYNNRFNNTNNFYLGTIYNNTWNTTKIVGTNIVGGSYIGGNFWARQNGTGFSQTCSDANSDGICDSPYMLDSNNTDYLPLAYNITAPLIGAVVSINNATAPSNANASTQIVLSNMNDFGMATIDLYYNHSIVQVTSAGLGFTGYGGSLTSNINNTIGKARFVITTTAFPGPNSPLTLVNVVLQAVGSAGQTSPLNLSVVTLAFTNGSTVTPMVNNGIFNIFCDAPGDVTGNCVVDAIDSMLLAQFVAGTRATLPQQQAGDVASPCGSIDAIDSMFVAQYVAGTRTSLQLCS